jgi:hypothetical protein
MAKGNRKAALLERLNTCKTNLTKVDWQFPGETKRMIANIAQSARSGFGVLADSLENLAPLRQLGDELKDIKRPDYDSAEKFTEALQAHTESISLAIDNLIEEVNELPDEAGEPDEVTGNLGTRTKLTFKVTKGGDETEVTSGDIAKGFIASQYLKPSALGEIPLAQALHKYMQDEGIELPGQEKGNDSTFYKLYRLMRPTIIRQHRVIQKEAGYTPPEKTFMTPAERVAKRKAYQDEQKAKRNAAKAAEKEATAKDDKPAKPAKASKGVKDPTPGAPAGVVPGEPLVPADELEEDEA